jgi:hypothetical protein
MASVPIGRGKGDYLPISATDALAPFHSLKAPPAMIADQVDLIGARELGGPH